MNVALVNPPYSLEERYSSKMSDKVKYCLPPLGLLYVAAATEQAGYNVKIIDMEARPDIPLSELNGFDVIGITTLTPNFPNVVNLVRNIRKQNPSAKIITGGPHTSGFYEEIVKSVPEVDFCVVGEGEITFPELLNKLDNPSEVLGVAYMCDGEFTCTGMRPFIQDLDTIPFPARHLVDMDDYHPLGNSYKKLPIANMMSSRGCPYGRCTFCFEAGRLGPKFRKRSPENVVKEIEQCIEKYNIKEVSFWDDDFIPDVEWLSKFNKLMKGKNIVWSCSQRASMLNRKNVRLMAKSGCWTVFFGIESGNEELLIRIQKGITLNQYIWAIDLCHKHNIEVRGSFIIGLPGETKEMGEKTIKFSTDCGVDFAQFCICCPYRGTKLYDDVVNMGYELSSNLSDYNSQTPVFVPEGYSSKEEIKQLQKKAYRKFYLRPTFFWQRIRSIRNFEDLKRYWDGFLIFLGVSK